MTQISAATDATGGLRVGDVFGRSYRVLARHFVPFAIVSAVSLAPEASLSAVKGADTLDAADSIQAVLAGLPAVVAGATFWLTLQTVVQAIILYGTFQDMRGRPVRFADSIVKGLSRILPIIGLSLVNTLAVVAALVLFIAPGIMLWVATCVAEPACVVERLGPIVSMKRSIALTRGHRWKLLGILAILVVIATAGDTLIGAILAATAEPPIVLVGRFLWNVVVTAFACVVVAVVYHDLRAAREGVDVDRMAAVFD